MTSPSRRDFLRLGALSTGALAGCAAFPSMAKALATAPASPTGTIQDVGHVVILMQENRSFDHYFGAMRGVRGFDDPRPVKLPNGRPVWCQPGATTVTSAFNARGLSADAPYVLPFYIDPHRTSASQPGIDHGWSSGHLAWNEGVYDQWVNQKQDALTMGFLRRADLPYHYALAEAFTVCDAYFCSTPADTAPNRIFLWTGTIDARNVHGKIPNGPGLEERNGTNGYTWTTYPERLEANGVSWKVYQGGTGAPGAPDDNYTNNSLEFFARYQVAQGAAGPLVHKGVSRHTLAELEQDALTGRLPQVSWVIAPKQHSEHPPATPHDGAFYIDQVVGALTADPAVWSKTVLFITYDENDGLFDHVVPPVPPRRTVPHASGMVSAELVASLNEEFLDLDRYPHEKTPLLLNADPGGMQPIGLGPRVPMIVVSPWSKGGWVCSQVFDHTSILRFLERRFGVVEPNISAWRRAICGDLTCAFDFSSGPDPSPVPIRLARAHVAPSAGMPSSVPRAQVMPRQERGVRPARALPYRVFLDGREAWRDGRFWLTLRNAGDAGAALYIYDRATPAAAPRRYAIVSGDAFQDWWDVTERGAYHLAVYGPNGMVCEFQGDAPVPARESTALPEVRLDHDAPEAALLLTLTNTGTAACVLTIVNAYQEVTQRKRNVRLEAGATAYERFDHVPSSGWYDVCISTDSPSGFSRRFAGHIETGQASTTDPGMRGAPE